MTFRPWEGRFYLFGAFTLAGTSVIAAKYVSDKLGVFTIAAASLLFALALLLPACGGRLVKALRKMPGRAHGAVFLQALFGLFLFRVFLLNGLNHTSSVEAGILTGATPAITAILAWVLLRETAGGRTLAGILSTVGGVQLVQGLAGVGEGFSAGRLAGNLLVLCAAASESIFNILSRVFASGKITDGEPLDPLVQTTLVTVVALCLCLIPASMERPLERMADIGLKEWLALIWYGVFVTALAFICWYAGIKRSGAFTAAAFSGMMPLTSMLLSMAILGERTGLPQWLGGLLVIAGMVLIGSGGAGRRSLTILGGKKRKEGGSSHDRGSEHAE